MNKYFIGIFGGVLVVVGLGFLAGYNFNKPVEKSLGSINQANEYHGTPLKDVSTGGAVLKASPGALGSVVITGAGAGVITIYNTTTTNANLRAGATSTLPVLASIPASTAAGTYTFDIIASDGLVYEITGTSPTSSITWR